VEAVVARTEAAPGVALLDRFGHAGAHQDGDGALGGVLRYTEIRRYRPHRRGGRAAVVGPLE
jgi:hypothetical protein